MQRGQVVTVHAAVSLAIRTAREAGRVKPWHEPYAALAMKFARQATAKDISGADLARISTRLEALLARLPLSEEVAADDRPGTPADRASEDRPRTPGLEPQVGASPAVGDTALP